MRIAHFCVAVAATTVAASGALAAGPDGYPSRPVTIIVPFAPGGGSDNVARIIATRLTEKAGGTFIIDNKPGAGTNIGNEAAARAKADGYTLLFGQVTLSINPSVYKSLRYDVKKDFVPVALVAGQPVVLVVNSASGFKTLADLVAAARQKPSTLSMASTKTSRPPPSGVPR